MKGATLAVKPDSRMAPVTLKVLDALADGEWHDQEDVIEAAMYVTPPGEAFRHASKRSNALVDRRSQDEIIASGQRTKAIDSINSLIANGRVERDGADATNTGASGKRIRMIEDMIVVYVCRSKDGAISVHPSKSHKVAIHVIDSMASDTDVDPQAELDVVSKLFEAMPKRIVDKDRLQSVFRELMNDLSIRATFRRAADSLFTEPEE